MQYAIIFLLILLVVGMAFALVGGYFGQVLTTELFPEEPVPPTPSGHGGVQP